MPVDKAKINRGRVIRLEGELKKLKSAYARERFRNANYRAALRKIVEWANEADGNREWAKDDLIRLIRKATKGLTLRIGSSRMSKVR